MFEIQLDPDVAGSYFCSITGYLLHPLRALSPSQSGSENFRQMLVFPINLILIRRQNIITIFRYVRIKAKIKSKIPVIYVNFSHNSYYIGFSFDHRSIAYYSKPNRGEANVYFVKDT